MKYTFRIDPDLMGALLDYHARHYDALGRKPFAAFIRDVLAAWLADATDQEALTAATSAPAPRQTDNEHHDVTD